MKKYYVLARLGVFVCWPALLLAIVVVFITAWPLIWFGHIKKDGDSYKFNWRGGDD